MKSCLGQARDPVSEGMSLPSSFRHKLGPFQVGKMALGFGGRPAMKCQTDFLTLRAGTENCSQGGPRTF